MKYLNIKHYILVLYNEGTKWEFEKILNSGTPLPKKTINEYSWKKRAAFLLPTAVLTWLLKYGIDDRFIGYAIAAFSIFIGLFASLIITVYDRFLVMPKLTGNETDQIKLEHLKVSNFIRQFTFVTGKNLLIATVIILVMSMLFVFPSNMKTNIFEYRFVQTISKASFEEYKCFFKLGLIFILRILVIYLIIDFFVLLLYSLGALFSFLKREYR
ncbi:hypothetical protein ACFE6N_04340 [Pedobacter sp. BG31]|uniref:hypothetical protein n=1 Tax=Pedobacter sp. BG31 TaxID=3349697 RepID=UPI0035F3D8E7